MRRPVALVSGSGRDVTAPSCCCCCCPCSPLLHLLRPVPAAAAAAGCLLLQPLHPPLPATGLGAGCWQGRTGHRVQLPLTLLVVVVVLVVLVAGRKRCAGGGGGSTVTVLRSLPHPLVPGAAPPSPPVPPRGAPPLLKHLLISSTAKNGPISIPRKTPGPPSRIAHSGHLSCQPAPIVNPLASPVVAILGLKHLIIPSSVNNDPISIPRKTPGPPSHIAHSGHLSCQPAPIVNLLAAPVVAILGLKHLIIASSAKNGPISIPRKKPGPPRCPAHPEPLSCYPVAIVHPIAAPVVAY